MQLTPRLSLRQKWSHMAYLFCERVFEHSGGVVEEAPRQRLTKCHSRLRRSVHACFIKRFRALHALQKIICSRRKKAEKF